MPRRVIAFGGGVSLLLTPKANSHRKDGERCPYRKSNPDVLMVQSSHERLGDDAASRLNGPRNRRILAQR
jgi:hypothetical protein